MPAPVCLAQRAIVGEAEPGGHRRRRTALREQGFGALGPPQIDLVPSGGAVFGEVALQRAAAHRQPPGHAVEAEVPVGEGRVEGGPERLQRTGNRAREFASTRSA